MKEEKIVGGIAVKVDEVLLLVRRDNFEMEGLEDLWLEFFLPK